MQKFLILLVTIAGLFAGQPRVFAQTGNLIANGGFESGVLTGWETCGGVRLADKNAGASATQVNQGRYALRLGYPTDGTCGSIVFEDQLQASLTGIQVPSDASNLTLSFWYSRVGNFALDSFSWHLYVYLDSSDGGEQIRIGGPIQADAAGGWNQARWELSPTDAAKARGRTFKLTMRVGGSLKAEDELAYYIDELQVLPAIVRTPLVATLPTAFQGDQARMLVGLADINGSTAVVRANLDGSGITAVYQPPLGSPNKPVWSPDGTRVAAPVDTFQRETNGRPSSTWAQITIVNTLDADGGNAREVFRTVGSQQDPGIPAGCRTPRTDCGKYETPAFDLVLGGVDWSPDGKRMVLNPCGWQRYSDGYRTDAFCQLDVINATTGITTGITTGTLFEGRNVDWGNNNQLLFLRNDGPFSTIRGIYSAPMATLPTTYTLVFAHKSPFYGFDDVAPTWSPDSRHFATLRFVPGNHYDADGKSQYNSAVMVFDTQDINNPKQLMLVDYANTLSTPRWSPDGRYILYTAQVSNTSVEQYWVDTTTGATGLLSKDLAYADWRPGATQIPNLQPRNYLPLIRR